MLMSSWAMNGAAGQVRAIDGNLQSLLSQLVADNVWSGADADRFAQDWHDQVHTLLINAANKMDGVAFEAVD